MTPISRHYISVDGRLVHYRKAGTGPLLLLLHQSPQSSLDHVELMGRWAGRFTMIAPDRPGCGQSDPLPDAAPGFDRYGDAIAAAVAIAVDILRAGLADEDAIIQRENHAR